MATVAHTFSPKEWKAAVVSDATNAGDEDMYIVEWEYKCMHLGNVS